METESKGLKRGMSDAGDFDAARSDFDADRSEVSGAPLESTRRRQGRTRLLFSAYVVLFTRYCIATFLSSFFTPVATTMGISGTFNGLIFAAYPLGMGLTSVVAPQLIEKMGTFV